MSIFHISDTHFGHERIIELCNRPFRDAIHMNEILVRKWNESIKPNDTVFHHGDVALGSWERWDSIMKRLNGHKILVIGNHDRIFAGQSQRYQERFTPIYSQWFEDYYDNIAGEFTLSNGMRVNLSHFPYDGDSHDGDRWTDYRLEDDGIPLIHGHTHQDKVTSFSKKGTLQIHVGVDAWEYRPVPEEKIIQIMEANV